MSEKRDDIVNFTNEILDLHKYPDYGPMGLQFTGSEYVDKIATAVSINKRVIEQAHDLGAQMLIVHHGMFWNNESRILDERVGGRLSLLEKYNMSVLAYHLALDAHPVIGNNRRAAEALGLRKLKPFGEIGWGGEFKDPVPVTFLKQLVLDKFGSTMGGVLGGNFLYGISKMAVIVGGASHYIVEAHREGYDSFFTGEVSEPAYHLAQDLGVNLFWAGHHATEQMGVQALGKQLKRRFRINTEYIQIPNPI